MEKGESKINIVQPEMQRGTSSRAVYWLTATVAFLALAFIVFIAAGSVYVSNNSQPCKETAKKGTTAPENTESYEVNVPTNGTTLNEQIIVDAETQTEYMIARDPKTGLLHSVVTIEHQKGQTTMYSAKNNICFLVSGFTGNFQDSVNGLRAKEHGPGQKELNFEVDDRVENMDDIPAEMSAFCTRSNSYWLREKSDDEDTSRTKRQAGCPYLCEYLAFIGYYYGYPLYYYVWWIDARVTCTRPCSGPYEYYFLG